MAKACPSLFPLFGALLVSPIAAEDKAPEIVTIEVDCSKTKRQLAANPTGFCMSFLNDADNDQRKKPFAEVLKSMGTGSLRFPMGTLAENYLFHDIRQGIPKQGALQLRVIMKKKNLARWPWAVNPDGSYSDSTLDFDEFITMCRASYTEPVVMVSSHGHLFSGSEFIEEDIIRNAEEWVRYANITCKMGVKYWEIGNEVDLKKNTSESIRVYQKMATRMKKVDPSIQVGLGTYSSTAYGKQELEKCPELVDFIVVHHYMEWMKTYDQYLKSQQSFMEDSEKMLSMIDKTAPVDRKRARKF